MIAAVLDVGKTNVKLSAATTDGGILETLTTANPTLPGPPWRHHDLETLESWIFRSLAALAGRHDIEAIVPIGHGSGSVLVGATGPAAPMIDYEQTPPSELDALYRAEAGGYRERGSAIMLGAAHAARQLLWMEHAAPEAVTRASALLALPQYWAWRLCGVAAGEVSSLGAQSHLWSVADRAFAPIVGRRGWTRLMPPLRGAWETLGNLHPMLAARTGLSARTRIVCGIHDSTANFYRYQAAGFANFAVVSTGTWIVALSDTADPARLDEARGMTCNADAFGRPLAGALAMGGREFSHVAGDPAAPGPSPFALAAALVARGTMALPWFGPDSSLFPARAGRGAIAGQPPDTPLERRALGILYTALLTDSCLDALDAAGIVVLDGPFVADPLFGALVAALRPSCRVRISREGSGAAAGAAMLAGHATRHGPATVALDGPPQLDIPALADYRARWRDLASRPEI